MDWSFIFMSVNEVNKMHVSRAIACYYGPVQQFHVTTVHSNHNGN